MANTNKHLPNSGTRTIARREWQARQEANKRVHMLTAYVIASAPVRKGDAR